jgi:hypothetical protein
MAALCGLLLWITGCETSTPPVIELTGAHAALAGAEMLRLSVLGIELTTALHQDPEDSECPNLTVDGNVHVLDYGGGCPPSSGSTAEGISGQVQFTVAPSTGWFVGSFADVGFSGHAVAGELSGSYTPVGDDAFLDLQFTSVQRTDRADLTLDALFEIAAAGDEYVIHVDGGLMVGPDSVDTNVLFTGVTVHNGSLDSCVQPTAGSIELRRGRHVGTLSFSPESASSGNVPFLLNSTPSGSIPICL